MRCIFLTLYCFLMFPALAAVHAFAAEKHLPKKFEAPVVVAAAIQPQTYYSGENPKNFKVLYVELKIPSTVKEFAGSQASENPSLMGVAIVPRLKIGAEGWHNSHFTRWGGVRGFLARPVKGKPGVCCGEFLIEDYDNLPEKAYTSFEVKVMFSYIFFDKTVNDNVGISSPYSNTFRSK